MIVLGTLLVPLALIAGKFMLMRFLFGMLSIKVPMLGGVITGLIGAFAKLGAAVLATPVGWLVLGIAAVAAAGIALINNWKPIKAFLRGFWEGFASGLAPLRGMLSSAFGGLLSLLEPLRPIWNWLANALGQAWDWFARLIAPVEATQEALTNAAQAGRGLGAWLSGLVVSLANLVGKFFSFGVDIARSVIGGVASMFGAIATVASYLVKLFSRLWQGIQTTASSAWQSITSTRLCCINRP